jgi:hypothetical protein
MSRSNVSWCDAAVHLRVGATAIERVDRLVQQVAAQRQRRGDAIDAIVDVVDLRLRQNGERDRTAFAA